jgi:hypothetical protein
MNRRQRLVAFFCTSFAIATPLSGNDALRMQVWPAVSREPAVLTVRVTVPPSADNRMLQIVAESRNFFRRSEVQIDGDQAAPLNVFEFRNLPTGTYQVTSVLVGAHGQRATATGLARVEPATGR